MSTILPPIIVNALRPSASRVALAIAVAGFTLLAAHRQRRKSSVQRVVAANSLFSPSYLPVAIFVGGTGGIGQGAAEAFARHTKGNSHIIIVGRNRAAGESIISKFPTPTVDGAKHEFVECDVALMKNVEQTTKALLERVPRVNFLFISTAFLDKLEREDTEEGLDKKLAIFYYARFKFINDLLPSLRTAVANGEPAVVHCIAGAGIGKDIDWNDLGLKRNYTMLRFRQQIPRYLDIITQVSISFFEP